MTKVSCGRIDGRGASQLRPVSISPSYLNTVPGSALIEMGQTRVLCTVSLETRVPPWLAGSGKGWLTCEYGMLPGSSPQRIARESATGRPNSRFREIQRMIGRSLRAIVDLTALGERTLYVDCDVIQADGGTRTASITGSYVALAQATATLIRDGELSADPVVGPLAAVSVGIVEGEVLLDLSYQEDSRAQTDMNVVMTASGGIVELQATAEGATFSRQESDQMLDTAADGIRQLLEYQSGVLEGTH
ncbi:MAG: ribonuclease PH [Gemmatimonadetes bacterium]|nr:ribonuclease PH [Gemmatimonadota bacterium]